MDSNKKCFIIIAPDGIQKFRCWDKSIVPKDFTIPERNDPRYYNENGILLPVCWAMQRYLNVTEEQLKHSFEYIEDEDDLLEKEHTKKIKKYLDKMPHVWYLKVHGEAMQRAGIPDILASVYGFFIGIEIKKKDGVVSEIQKHCHTELFNKGESAVIVAFGYSDFKNKFERVYEVCQKRYLESFKNYMKGGDKE